MSILIVNGAPRKQGYSRELTALLGRGVEDAGGKAETIELGAARIETCRGCYGCWHGASPGECVIHDDMKGLLERYRQSRIVVFASPLYFYSFSGLMKTFIDRLLPLLSPDLEQGDTPGMVHHRLRHPTGGPRKCVLMMTAGHRDEQVIAGLRATFSLMARALGLTWVGTLFRPESFFIDFAVGKEKTLRRVREAYETAGRELVTEGLIRAETEAAASQPLANDLDTFLRQTGAFWDVAMTRRVPISQRKEIRAAVLENLTVVMPAVADCFDSRGAGELNAVFNFNIEDASNGEWCFIISGGTCRAEARLSETPDVSIETDHKTWMAILKQNLDARLALTKKQLRVDGNLRLFSRFGRIFPSASS